MTENMATGSARAHGEVALDEIEIAEIDTREEALCICNTGFGGGDDN